MAKSNRQQAFAFDNEPSDSGSVADSTDSKPTAGEGAAEGAARKTDESSAPEVAEVWDHADMAGRTVYVVDSHALLYQVFHAMPEMTSPSGQPVGAIHGFTRDMLDIMERKRPDYLICAFDHSEKTFRHEFYPEYKETRDSMPDDLRPQVSNVQRMLEALGIPIISLPTYEADDILATIAAETERRGGKCYVVTSDKDCRQLITDNVFMYNIRKDAVMDAEGVMEVWGVRPDQVVDFQALVGDSVDNVPGVALIGPKIAKELLQQYETLEGVLDNADKLSGKKRKENLMNGREQAMLSRRLVKLDSEVPMDVDWDAARVGLSADREEVASLCQEFGFRQLAERLGGVAVQEAPRAEWIAEYKTVTSLDELRDLAKEMSSQSVISIDTETTSTNPRWAKIVGYSFAWVSGEAYYVPVMTPEADISLPADDVADILRPILEDPNVGKVGQNIKYDMVVLRGAGINLQGVTFDTMVADYLLDAGGRNHSMDDMALRYLNHETTKISDLIGKGKNQKRMDEVPVELVTPYAAEDADVPLRLMTLLSEEMDKQGLTELFDTLEVPLVNVLAEMEFNGIRIDTDLLASLSERYSQRLSIIEKDIYELAEEEFNIDSRIQLGKVLFEKLELPVIKKTKTGPSADAEVLEQLAAMHPLPAKIIEYRQCAKLKSTYIDALPKLVCPETGRVHTSFKQDVAATGRLSSKDPNLQNIPVRNDAGREIRSAFLPKEGWKLLTADYSQIELRVLAHFSGDAALLETFDKELDVHTSVAAEVYGVAQDDVTSEMRRSAKAINFGIIYGQSPFGLAKSLGISKDEAAEFIEAYFARYPGVDEFMIKTLDDCCQNGYVSTILGRQRSVKGVRSSSSRPDSRQRTLPERIAINTVIQGSAADLIKVAMIRIPQKLRDADLEAKMLLQIHDELIFETPEQEVEALSELIVEEMTSVGKLQVPLRVDPKVGDNWAECELL